MSDVSLTNIEKLMVGLSWDPNDKKEGVLDESIVPHNLDVSCVVLSVDKQIIDVIKPNETMREKYKNQIFHLGDHLSGGSDFEDEEIQVSLQNLNNDIGYLLFVVSANGKVGLADAQNGVCAFLDGVSLSPLLSVNLSKTPGQQCVAGVVSRDGENGWTLRSLSAANVEADGQDLVDAVKDQF